MFIRSEPEREVASRTSPMSVLLEAITCHIFESKKKKKKAAEASLDQETAAARSSFVTFSVATAPIPIRAKPDFRMADPTRLLEQCTQVFFCT